MQKITVNIVKDAEKSTTELQDEIYKLRTEINRLKKAEVRKKKKTSNRVALRFDTGTVRDAVIYSEILRPAKAKRMMNRYTGYRE